MITEEMLREAAHKASEALTAYYERDYDPQKQYEIPPEFEKRIQDFKDGKMPGRLNAPPLYQKTAAPPARTKTAIEGLYCRFGT